MERFQLLYFFLELIKLGMDLPGRPGFGWPCSSLLESMVLKQQSFIDRIRGDYSGEFNEYRLNGAGLKLHWKVERTNMNLTDSPDDNCGPIQFSKFKCYISGDQKDDYTGFVVAAEKYIRERGYNHR